MLECSQEQEKAHMDFVEKLKTLRKESGYTQQEIADKLYVSRSLYAKYESGLATPSKDILQKMAILFDTGVNELISNEETTFMVVEEENTRQALKNTTLIASIVICSIFILFYFIPLFQAYSYVYPVNPGETPERIMRLKSAFSLLNDNNAVIGNITFAMCMGEIVLAALCLSLFNKKNIIVRYITYIIFALVVFMIFMTIAFSFGFSA